jgi:hypothetical protein
MKYFWSYIRCRHEYVFLILLQDEHDKVSRGSSVSIVTDYGLNDRGSIPDRGRGFFF